MFGASLLEELPVRDADVNKKKRINLLKKKLSEGTPIQTLNEADIQDMQRVVERVKKMKTSYVKSCFYCSVKYFCKKDREQRLREQAESLFEKRLDIRSFVKL